MIYIPTVFVDVEFSPIESPETALYNKKPMQFYLQLQICNFITRKHNQYIFHITISAKPTKRVCLGTSAVSQNLSQSLCDIMITVTS